jgi:hypothetical protein
MERQPKLALAGPLKILVAVAAPTHGLGVGAVLDSEQELHAILSAIEEEARLGRAEVRVLEIASLDRLGRALEREAYHVVLAPLGSRLPRGDRPGGRGRRCHRGRYESARGCAGTGRGAGAPSGSVNVSVGRRGERRCRRIRRRPGDGGTGSRCGDAD